MYETKAHGSVPEYSMSGKPTCCVCLKTLRDYYIFHAHKHRQSYILVIWLTDYSNQCLYVTQSDKKGFLYSLFTFLTLKAELITFFLRLSMLLYLILHTRNHQHSRVACENFKENLSASLSYGHTKGTQ